MKHSLTIKDLLERPIIRNDNAHEFLNKMTDEEIEQWDKEIMQMLDDNKVEHVFPDWNAAYLAKVIDTQILYDLFKLGEKKHKQCQIQ